jgi:hypothetical protein
MRCRSGRGEVGMGFFKKASLFFSSSLLRLPPRGGGKQVGCEQNRLGRGRTRRSSSSAVCLRVRLRLALLSLLRFTIIQ